MRVGLHCGCGVEGHLGLTTPGPWSGGEKSSPMSVCRFSGPWPPLFSFSLALTCRWSQISLPLLLGSKESLL